MSTRQTALINGLLVENLGKNELIRQAESRFRYAESVASDAEHDAEMAEIRLSKAKKEIAQLQKALEEKIQEAEHAQQTVNAYKQQANAYRHLLSRPMKEIADMNGDFKKTYELQQQMLAEWIMGQKAYRETAMQLGAALGMTPEQVQKVAAPNYTAVLENRTQHGNDGSASPTLAQYADTILTLRRKNGKA